MGAIVAILGRAGGVSSIASLLLLLLLLLLDDLRRKRVVDMLHVQFLGELLQLLAAVTDRVSVSEVGKVQIKVQQVAKVVIRAGHGVKLLSARPCWGRAGVVHATVKDDSGGCSFSFETLEARLSGEGQPIFKSAGLVGLLAGWLRESFECVPRWRGCPRWVPNMNIARFSGSAVGRLLWERRGEGAEAEIADVHGKASVVATPAHLPHELSKR